MLGDMIVPLHLMKVDRLSTGRAEKQLVVRVQVFRCLLFFALTIGSILGSSLPLHADSDATRRYLIDDWQNGNGLSQSTITGLAQTPDGYLWISTLDGIARFDGIRFKLFKSVDTPALGSGRIRFLFRGRKGVLWLCMQEGGIIQLQNNQFTPILIPKQRGMPLPTIHATEDITGNLWLSDEDGGIAQLKDGLVTQVSSNNWTTQAGGPLQLTADHAGHLWAVGGPGLFRFDKGRLIPILTGQPNQYVVHCASRSGGWWISTKNKVGLWCDGTWLFRTSCPTNLPRSLRAALEDHGGRLWLGTLGEGLFCYNTNGTTLRFSRNDGLGNDFIRTVFEDKEDNLWVGTEGGGLSRLRLSLFGVYGQAQGIPTESITSITKGISNDLWIATFGEGLLCLPRNGKATAIADPATSNYHILTALADQKGNIWFGTGSGGIFCWNKGSLTRITIFPTNSPPLRCLYEDSTGMIWFGCYRTNRLVCLKDKKVSFVDLPNYLGMVDIRVITGDSAGNIWIGTDGAGLLRWKNRQFTLFTRKEGLGSDFIWALHPESKDTLWIGSYGGGLTRFKNNRMVNCTTRQGLADNVICYIADDGLGYYWFSSHEGIFRVLKKDLNRFADGQNNRIQCIDYGRSDGLPTLECKGGFQPAGCCTRDGRLWFPTRQGLVVVDPVDVCTNVIAPIAHIEEAVVDGTIINITEWQKEKSMSVHRISSSSTLIPTLEIPSGRRRLEIRYTSLNFSTPEKLRFRHCLEGVDAGWVDTGSERSTSYNRLPHGNYIFRVQACNREGVWSVQSDNLMLIILPAPWQTWWFEGLFVLILGSLAGWGVGTIILQRHRRHLRLVEQLNRLERERIRVARDIHDDLGSSLTAMGFWGARAARDCKTLSEAQGQLLSIAGRTRDLGRKLEETVWAVNPKNDSSGHLVSYLCHYIQEFLENKDIRCRLHLASDIPDVTFTTETRHNIVLAVKEATNNAVKHAHATEIELCVSVEDHKLVIKIVDNGTGFTASTVRPEGNGLHNMSARMDEIGGQCEVTSTPGKGTEVKFCQPLPYFELDNSKNKSKPK